MDINTVVQVNITRETKVPTQKGFGTPGVLSDEAGLLAGLEAVTTYNSDTALTEMVADGFLTTDETYLCVRSIVSQNPRPEKVKIIKLIDADGPVLSLQNAADVDDDWYFLLSTVSTKAHIEAVAAHVETLIKLFVYQTDEADVSGESLAADVPGVAGSSVATLKSLNYDRSFGVVVPTAKLSEYKQAGWVGRQATRTPGSTNWKFKSVKAASADKWTSQELKNIQDKNGNVYVTVGGIDMFMEGVVASGEYIDIMIGTDWIQARMKEAVFGLLTKEEKVSFDDAGIESVVVQMESILDQAVKNQILISDANLDEDGNGMGPKVTAPKRSETTVAARAARTLEGVSFTGNYAGAINKVKIDGRLSV